MTPSELADKLEQGGIFRITPEEEALRTKCVRFAADMEVLMDHGLGVWFERGSYRVGIDVKEATGDIFIEKSYEGSDIYTAARKAVEALEGGK